MKLLAQIFLLIMVFLSGCDQQPVWHDNTGRAMSLSDFHGKWILINYWATWCTSCYKEIPLINDFYHTYKNRQVAVLGVNYDYLPANQLSAAIKKMNVQFPVLIEDPKKQFGVENISGLPTTLVINPNGKLQDVLTGEQTRQSLEALIK